MMEIVGLLGLGLAVAGLVVAFRWRHQKVLRFGYRVDDVLFVDEALARPERRRPGGALIDATVHRVRIRFCNGGNREIRVADMDGPVSVGFGEGSVALDFKVGDKTPVGLHVEGSMDSGEVNLCIGSMNPKDTFLLTVLVREFHGSVNVLGRILGAKVRRYPSGELVKAIGSLASLPATIGGIILGLGFDWSPGLLMMVIGGAFGIVFGFMSAASFEDLGRSVMGLPEI